MRLFSVVSLLSLSFVVTAAEKITVYKWTNAQGIVNYSQNPPKQGEFQEMVLTNFTKAQINEQQQLADAAKKKSNIVDLSTLCKNATDNYETLTKFDKIQYTSDDGVSHLLTDKEKQAQIKLYKKQMDVYCD